MSGTALSHLFVRSISRAVKMLDMFALLSMCESGMIVTNEYLIILVVML